MFTGIISDMGEVIMADEAAGDLRLRIRTAYDANSIKLGESIACNGACLTVVDKGSTPQNWFDVQLSAETVSCTAPAWQQGSVLNLERALKVGDDLSGHMVSGHIDGVARLTSITASGDSHRLVFHAPPELAKFIAPKGSVTLHGVSLTVNAADGAEFEVNIIPHSWQHTNFKALNVGDGVNIEIDLLARYIARLGNPENLA